MIHLFILISNLRIYWTFFLADCSILELYILVCMKRLEVKEQNSYNFNSVMKGALLLFLWLFCWNFARRQAFFKTFFIIECDRVQEYTWFIPDIWLLFTKCMLTGMLALDEIFTLIFFLLSFLLGWALYLFLLPEKFPGVMQAFEHLLQRELICFADNRGHNQSIEFRPAKLLITAHELHHGLKAYRSCPVSC